MQTGLACERLLMQLLEAAICAPSGDNTQPWRFQIDAERCRIVARVDESRDPSPMNAGQRMARIAVGAAVENILRTASHNGWRASVVETPETANSVEIRFDEIRGDVIKIEDVLRRRVTNRKPYDGQRAPPELLSAVAAQTTPIGGVRTVWIGETPRIEQFARLIGRADAMMFGERSMRQAFLENVRFDALPDEPVAEGLPLASLEMPSRDIKAFRTLAPLPDSLLKILGFGRKIAKASRRLVESSAGLCLGVAPDASPATDFLAGARTHPEQSGDPADDVRSCSRQRDAARRPIAEANARTKRGCWSDEPNS
jgi:hypothetical protein